MDIVTSLSKKELEQIIFDQVSKCLNDKLFPTQPEPSDRCGLDDACIELGVPGKPVSKAYVYSLTNKKKVAFRHNGRFLEFSRRQLRAYREAHTLIPASAEEAQRARLQKSALKKIQSDAK